MVDTPQQSRVNRTASPSPELAKLIELVNGLPKDACDTVTMEYRVRLADPGLGVFEVMKEVAGCFEAELERSSEIVREHTGPARDSHGLIIAAESQGRYNRLIVARSVLEVLGIHNGSAIEVALGMARALKTKRPMEDVKAVTRETLLMWWERLPMSEVQQVVSRIPDGQRRDITVSLRWSVNKKRELEFVSIPGFPAIEQNDCLRIRQCPRCGKIFFAGRLHQSACPEPCAHILRTLRWREAYNAKYKRQRYEKAESQDATKKPRGSKTTVTK